MLARTGLTPRAVGFLLAGAALLGVGVHRGWPPLAQLGLFLVVLPLASLAAVALRRDAVTVVRLLGTVRPELGDRMALTLEVTPRRGGMGALLISDEASPGLGGTHVVAVAGTARQVVSHHRRELLASRRGRQVLGPARMYLSDRLGLVARSAEVAGRTEVIVTPRCHDLATAIPGGAVIGSGLGTSGAAGGNQDDVIPRDYRPGDELRRVDWRATARTGTLMVRGEEQPWRAALVIVVDLRERSHRGPEGGDSLEAVLSLVASVGNQALESGWDLRILDTTATEILDARSGDPGSSRDDLLVALADVGVTANDHPDSDLAWAVSGGGPVLLVAGALPAATIAGLADHLGGGSPRLAVVAATGSWTGEDPHVVDPVAREAMDTLAVQGWTVAALTRGGGVVAAWNELAGDQPATPVAVGTGWGR